MVAETLCEFRSFLSRVLGLFANDIDRSQLVYRLDEAGAIRLPANTIVSVWNSFNQRYYGDGTSRIDAVGKIAFNDDYVHISIPGIDYA